MICGPIEPCGLDECAALELVQALLPRGKIWQIGLGRDVYDGFWSAIAAFASELSQAVCAEWCEASPCTANITIERWAAVWGFPTDCITLDAAKLCEWITLVSCGVGRCDFIPRLLGLAGISGIDVEISGGCDVPLANTCGQITITADAAMFADPPQDAIGIGWSPTINGADLCDTLFLDCGIIEPCGDPMICDRVIPQIECLRHRFFPAGIPVKYIQR